MAVSVFLPTKAPLVGIVNDFYHGSSLARPETTCFGRCGPRKVRVPHKKPPFLQRFAPRCRSFGFLSLLGDLGQRCRVIEGPVGGRETVFFKGK